MPIDAFNLLNELPLFEEVISQYYLTSIIPLFILAIIFINYLGKMSNSFKNNKFIVSILILTFAIVIFDILAAYLLYTFNKIIRYFLELFPHQLSLYETNSIIEKINYFTVALSSLIILVLFIFLFVIYMIYDTLILYNLKSISSKNLDIYRQKNINKMDYFENLSKIYNTNLHQFHNEPSQNNKLLSISGNPFVGLLENSISVRLYAHTDAPSKLTYGLFLNSYLYPSL